VSDFLNSEPFQLYWRSLGGALIVTLELTVGAAVVATVLGLVLALLRRLTFRPAVVLSQAATYVVRSIPQPPFLLIMYFSIQRYFGSSQPQQAVILALGILLAPWMAELFRAGIESVPRGLVEAGEALGCSSVVVQRRIVLPIAFRVMLPAIGQLMIGLMLSTAIGSQIGTRDVTGLARPIINDFFATQLWVVVALIYFALAFPLSRLFTWLERRSMAGL
jgi:His/Glu/Gln/Arg/opine family amino acid ABC transporter permease subunit